MTSILAVRVSPILREGDDTGPRQPIPKEIGEWPKDKDAMGDSPLKNSFLCIGLVEMNWIEILCHSGEILDTLLCNRLGDLSRIPNF